MIDSDGFRAGVAIVIFNKQRKLFWAKRIGQNAWQFPQGGLQEGETATQAMYRELKEETGLDPQDVEIITVSRTWMRYYLPKHLIRQHSKPLCIGQKQKWFLLKFVGDEDKIRFDAVDKPEFDGWAWVNYWHPMKGVINFKRDVYHRALKIFSSYVFRKGKRPRRVQDKSEGGADSNNSAS